MSMPQDAPILIQPPPPGPRPGRTRLVAMLVTASVVLATAVAAGVWLLLSPSSPAGQQGSQAKRQSHVPWSLPYTKSGREHPTMVRGLWFTDKAVVKALPDGIAGLDRNTGERLWGRALNTAAAWACARRPR
ncbi:hypothetical protein ACFU99_30320, partial [Streptomyces sp. NPDC057654]